MSKLQAEYRKFTLTFVKPMGTSRGLLTDRDIFILALRNEQGVVGLGECASLPKLSFDDQPGFEARLSEVCASLREKGCVTNIPLTDWPAIRFGVETAALCLQRFQQPLFDTDFTRGVRCLATNGLIVMASLAEMLVQVRRKVEEGFRCIKIKIGAHDFDDEFRLLHDLRKRWAVRDIELRLDANGAFSPSDALEKLKALAPFRVHSIEQPIPQGDWQAMAKICAQSPVPIALDEELIGIHQPARRRRLLDTIRPAFLILKPTLLGGFAACQEWISLCERRGIGYWITSILESNIGLSAIAQWTSTLSTRVAQGLGTGQLYRANFDSPVRLRRAALSYEPAMGRHATSLKDLVLQ